MKNIKLAVAVAAALTMTSGMVMAEAWDVTQKAEITTNNTTVDQKGTTSGSLQGINSVNDAAADVSGSQDTKQTAGTFTLQQTDTVSDSTQAINYTKANSVATGYTQDFTATAGGTTLRQTTSGQHVVQGINIIDTSTGGIDATQTVVDNATLTMEQTGTNLALQVANGALTGGGATTNTIVQNGTVAGLDLDQNNATDSTQSFNYVGVAR